MNALDGKAAFLRTEAVFWTMVQSERLLRCFTTLRMLVTFNVDVVDEPRMVRNVFDRARA